MVSSTGLRANLLLALIATSLPFVALEVSLRLHHAYTLRGSGYRVADDPAIGFVRKPHAYRGINALGFRGHEYTTKKPAGVFRIVAVGDSVTNGYGVARANIYSERLEAHLDAHGPRYEVINFGTNQYSTVQEVALFKQVGVPLEPDVVIVGYVLNDPERDGWVNHFVSDDRAPSLAFLWLARRLDALWPRRRARHEIRGCDGFDYYASLHCDADKWAAVTAAFRELRDLSRQHGFRVLLVVFPLLPDGADATFDGYRWASIHERVAAEARENGFSVLDLRPVFARRRPAELKVAPDDMLHPNAVGHRIAAHAISDALRTLASRSGRPTAATRFGSRRTDVRHAADRLGIVERAR